MFVLATILGVWGLNSLRTFKKQFDAATDETVHNLVLADATVTANSEMISAQRGIVLAAFSRDMAGFAKYQATFKENVELIRTSVAAMAPTELTGEATALRSEITAKVREWRPHYDDLVRTAAANDVKEADRIRRDLTAPIYKQIDKYARRMAAVETQAMAENKQAISNQYNRTLWITGALLVIFALTGVVVVTVVQGVSRDLRATAAELSEGAEQVGRAAAQVSSSSQVLASGSSQQAASLEETSASAEQINSMARRNSQSSQSAAELVRQSQEKFSQANKSLEGMVVAMGEINTSSD